MAKKTLRKAAVRPKATRQRTSRAASRPAETSGGEARTDEPIVVYVHGIGRQPAKEDLKLDWDLALFGKDRGPATRMAYWADLIHGITPRRARSLAGTSEDLSAEDLSTEAVLAEAGVSPGNADARAYVSGLRSAYGFDERRGGRAMGRRSSSCQAGCEDRLPARS
jgi:hypothetical protein